MLPTIHQALTQARVALRDVSDAPGLDAQRLLLQVLHQPESGWLFSHAEEQLTQAQMEAFQGFLARRLQGEPLAYITGSWDFYGRSFTVTPDVLIPRPATEELVEQAITSLQTMAAHKKRPLIVADIGTGSGCIAITLARELSPAVVTKIYATDISPQALMIARHNAALHRITNRLEFLEGDMLAPVVNKKIDLIVSNPPYVPTAEIAKAGRVRDTLGLQFEPHLALDGGTDGHYFTQQLSELPIPTLLETTGGTIVTHHLEKKKPRASVA